jgi:hypothetical protein
MLALKQDQNTALLKVFNVVTDGQSMHKEAMTHHVTTKVQKKR